AAELERDDELGQRAFAAVIVVYQQVACRRVEQADERVGRLQAGDGQRLGVQDLERAGLEGEEVDVVGRERQARDQRRVAGEQAGRIQARQVGRGGQRVVRLVDIRLDA